MDARCFYINLLNAVFFFCRKGGGGRRRSLLEGQFVSLLSAAAQLNAKGTRRGDDEVTVGEGYGTGYNYGPSVFGLVRGTSTEPHRLSDIAVQSSRVWLRNHATPWMRQRIKPCSGVPAAA